MPNDNYQNDHRAPSINWLQLGLQALVFIVSMVVAYFGGVQDIEDKITTVRDKVTVVEIDARRLRVDVDKLESFKDRQLETNYVMRRDVDKLETRMGYK